jgi:hypothetical protein
MPDIWGHFVVKLAKDKHSSKIPVPTKSQASMTAPGLADMAKFMGRSKLFRPSDAPIINVHNALNPNFLLRLAISLPPITKDKLILSQEQIIYPKI